VVRPQPTHAAGRHAAATMSIPIERLVRRVEVIARNCAPDPVDSQGNTVKLDEFTRKKKDIAQHIRATRAVRST